jgi:hypothetical protein
VKEDVLQQLEILAVVGQIGIVRACKDRGLQCAHGSVELANKCPVFVKQVYATLRITSLDDHRARNMPFQHFINIGGNNVERLKRGNSLNEPFVNRCLPSGSKRISESSVISSFARVPAKLEERRI